MKAQANRNEFCLKVTATTATCPVGETVGERNLTEARIPVLSCEGACIRGEIARLAANELGRTPGFSRACHGELFSVPGSAMARWVKGASRVVVIDGCHLQCHGRVVEHLVGPGKLAGFNALARYRKYSDAFDIDAVPEGERRAVARDVAGWVLGQLREPGAHGTPAGRDASAAEPGCETSGCG